jgi:hypothetical protein
MAELVDAPGSGPGGGDTVEVRVLFWAPIDRIETQALRREKTSASARQNRRFGACSAFQDTRSRPAAWARPVDSTAWTRPHGLDAGRGTVRARWGRRLPVARWPTRVRMPGTRHARRTRTTGATRGCASGAHRGPSVITITRRRRPCRPRQRRAGASRRACGRARSPAPPAGGGAAISGRSCRRARSSTGRRTATRCGWSARS